MPVTDYFGHGHFFEGLRDYVLDVRGILCYNVYV